MKEKIVATFCFHLVQVERLDNRKEQHLRRNGEPEVLRVTLQPTSPQRRYDLAVDALFTFTTSYFSEMGQFLITAPLGTLFEVHLSTMVPDYLPPGEDAFARGMKNLVARQEQQEEESTDYA